VSEGLVLREVSLRLGAVEALRSASLRAAPGEYVAVVGPSGSGKSSLVRCAAGLAAPDAGWIGWDGTPWSDPRIRVPPHRRGIGWVPQDLALWPHRTARGHVEYVLRLAGVPAGERERRAREALGRVGLSERAQHRPAHLSGGEAQRLALARALAAGPRLLLLDEPLGQLDLRLRRDLAAEVRAIVGRTGAAAVHVTHDAEEALGLGDRVVVIEGGEIVQDGTPASLERSPATAFVATVTGRPNVVPPGLVPGLVASLRVREDDPRFARLRDGSLAFAAGALCVAPEGAAAEVVGALRVDGRRCVRLRLGGTVVVVACEDPPSAGAAVRVACA
jgi:ABC-type Fe3+/spermidine/putrescine transport system ATPase subunit